MDTLICPLDTAVARLDLRSAADSLGRVLTEHGHLLPEYELADINDAHVHLLRLLRNEPWGEQR